MIGPFPARREFVGDLNALTRLPYERRLEKYSALEEAMYARRPDAVFPLSESLLIDHANHGCVDRYGHAGDPFNVLAVPLVGAMVGCGLPEINTSVHAIRAADQLDDAVERVQIAMLGVYPRVPAGAAHLLRRAVTDAVELLGSPEAHVVLRGIGAEGWQPRGSQVKVLVALGRFPEAEAVAGLHDRRSDRLGCVALGRGYRGIERPDLAVQLMDEVLGPDPSVFVRRDKWALHVRAGARIDLLARGDQGSGVLGLIDAIKSWSMGQDVPTARVLARAAKMNGDRQLLSVAVSYLNQKGVSYP